MNDEPKRETAASSSKEPALRRTIGPAQMALYGLGSMLGAGLYGLVGKTAGQTGNALWLAFVVALIAALLTALSYASLGSRHPRAAGAAYVTGRAYGYPLLSFVVGLALVCSGLTSIATQSRVFAANFIALFGLESVPVWLLALGFLLILTGIVFRGIRESMWVNVLCTLVEAGGLVLVIVAGISYWGSVDYFETPVLPNGDHAILLVMQGAVLAFFAFIGFEDMINVAEETRDPKRTIPLGLILAMAGAAVLYIAVAITAVSVVPWQDLAAALGAHHRGDGARRAFDLADCVYRHHVVRHSQHRSRQLRHRIAPDLRHGAARPPPPRSAASTPQGERRISPSPRCSSCWRRSRCSARSPSLPRRPCFSCCSCSWW